MLESIISLDYIEKAQLKNDLVAIINIYQIAIHNLVYDMMSTQSSYFGLPMWGPLSNWIGC